jgi:hypothetical protein
VLTPLSDLAPAFQELLDALTSEQKETHAPLLAALGLRLFPAQISLRLVPGADYEGCGCCPPGVPTTRLYATLADAAEDVVRHQTFITDNGCNYGHWAYLPPVAIVQIGRLAPAGQGGPPSEEWPTALADSRARHETRVREWHRYKAWLDESSRHNQLIDFLSQQLRALSGDLTKTAAKTRQVQLAEHTRQRDFLQTQLKTWLLTHNPTELRAKWNLR